MGGGTATRTFGVGVELRFVCVGWEGNRDKEGSDGDDDDEGTWTLQA